MQPSRKLLIAATTTIVSEIPAEIAGIPPEIAIAGTRTDVIRSAIDVTPGSGTDEIQTASEIVTVTLRKTETGFGDAMVMAKGVTANVSAIATERRIVIGIGTGIGTGIVATIVKGETKKRIMFVTGVTEIGRVIAGVIGEMVTATGKAIATEMVVEMTGTATEEDAATSPWRMSFGKTEERNPANAAERPSGVRSSRTKSLKQCPIGCVTLSRRLGLRQNLRLALGSASSKSRSILLAKSWGEWALRLTRSRIGHRQISS